MKMADVPFLHLSLNSRSPSSKSFGTIVATERSKSFDCNRRDSDGAIWFAACSGSHCDHRPLMLLSSLDLRSRSKFSARTCEILELGVQIINLFVVLKCTKLIRYRCNL